MSKHINHNYIHTLKRTQSTLFETSTSDSGVVHDGFVNILRMTPEEIKNKGEFLTISYSFSESQFGQLLIASTHKGICYLGFSDDEELAFHDLQRRFINTDFIQQTDEFHDHALKVFNFNFKELDKINLYLNGTDFQFKVWEELLKIPMGRLTTYGNIAESIQKPKSSKSNWNSDREKSHCFFNSLSSGCTIYRWN